MGKVSAHPSYDIKVWLNLCHCSGTLTKDPCTWKVIVEGGKNSGFCVPFTFPDLKISQKDILHNPVVQSDTQTIPIAQSHWKRAISLVVIHSYFLSSYPFLPNKTLSYSERFFMVILFSLTATQSLCWGCLHRIGAHSRAICCLEIAELWITTWGSLF